MQDDLQAEPRSPGNSGARDGPSFLNNVMERIKSVFRRTPSYEPLLQNGDAGEHEESFDGPDESRREGEKAFSWADYLIFMLIGVAMLWAWYAPSPPVCFMLVNIRQF